jgi:hypothetical protein
MTEREDFTLPHRFHLHSTVHMDFLCQSEVLIKKSIFRIPNLKFDVDFMSSPNGKAAGSTSHNIYIPL